MSSVHVSRVEKVVTVRESVTVTVQEFEQARLDPLDVKEKEGWPKTAEWDPHCPRVPTHIF